VPRDDGCPGCPGYPTLPNTPEIRRCRIVPGTDVSSPFVMMNRNKRGVALNLRSDEGRAALGLSAHTPGRRFKQPNVDFTQTNFMAAV